MSYARWLNSNWYAFWSCSSGKTKSTQVLALWHIKRYNCETFVPEYKYSYLKKNIDNIFTKEFANISKKDKEEGKRLIKIFIEDVDKTFQKRKKNDSKIHI